MAIFSDVYLQQLLDQAEQDISQQVKCIFNRFSLAVTQGTAEYDLPDNTNGILAITWKGIEIDPLTHEDVNYSQWLKPANLSTEGFPRFFLRIGYGFNKIKFHPLPNETFGADDTDLDTIIGINRRVIIYSYKVASSSNRLPSYLRRNLIKYNAMARAYAREGKAQNLQASSNFDKRFKDFLGTYNLIIQKIPKAVQFQFGPEVTHLGTKLPRPILPTSGKWSMR